MYACHMRRVMLTGVGCLALVATPGFAQETMAGGTTGVPAAEAPSSSLLNLLPDGDTKRRFILDCTGCHQFDAATVGSEGHFKSHDDWRTRIAQMLSFAGARTAFPIIAPGRHPVHTADWLVQHLGDEQVPLPDVTGAWAPAEGVEFTEYDLGAPDLPHDVALDLEGRVIITGQLSGQMYVLDPTSGEVSTSEAIPTPQANPRAVEVDDSGAWWVLLGGPERVARHDPAVGGWETWDIAMHPHSIARAEDGRIWFNGHFSKDPEQIGVLDPESGRVRTFDVPVPPTDDDGSNIPYGLRFGPDGTLWGTQLIGNRLVRFDPDSNDFETFTLPTSHSGPRRLDVAPDGTVWIPLYSASGIARFDPGSESFTEYELPIADALPYIVRVDAARGWVWIATAGADALLRFHLADERFEVFPYPTPRSLVRHMTLDAESGDLWLAYGNFPPVTPKIVRARPYLP